MRHGRKADPRQLEPAPGPIADVDDPALAATARELGVLGVRTDVTDPDGVSALAERAVAEYGEVHVMCNNAGVGPFAYLTDMTPADWR
jgi:NAD(P)-dependent dehydrogenase (short-subunit alcohol dehydrogenase family)